MGFTYTKRIHLVYLWYTSLHKKVHSVYNMYTSGFIFLGCLYDHQTFTLFKHNIFLLSQSLADAC